jgi:hypothetical protein
MKISTAEYNSHDDNTETEQTMATKYLQTHLTPLTGADKGTNQGTNTKQHKTNRDEQSTQPSLYIRSKEKKKKKICQAKHPSPQQSWHWSLCGPHPKWSD